MTPLASATTDIRDPQYQALKGRIHQDLLARLNLERLTKMSRTEAEPEIRGVIQQLLDKENQRVPLSLYDRENIVQDVLHEVFGLGPLEVLLQDPTISDILVNRASQVYIEREGRIEETDIVFRDDKHLMQIIERIVSAVGRRVDESSPMVDARLQDGSRVNAIIPPLALDGPAHVDPPISHRSPRRATTWSARESLTQPMLDFLQGAVAARLNIIVSGGTGAGKTTLLNVLSSFISGNERIVTIEDAAELMLRQRHVVRLETRPPNIEGKGAVRQRQLVINALRMRPDRIVVGEVRGEEALDMLQAMNTGHDGSLTTIHANSPRDALYRLDTMVAMANLNIPDKRRSAAGGVGREPRGSDQPHVGRHPQGHVDLRDHRHGAGRHHHAGDLRLQEDAASTMTGKVIGAFRATGIRPKCADQLATAGHPLPMDMFEHVQPVGAAPAMAGARNDPWRNR